LDPAGQGYGSVGMRLAQLSAMMCTKHDLNQIYDV
jgi:hypothetical protein